MRWSESSLRELLEGSEVAGWCRREDIEGMILGSSDRRWPKEIYLERFVETMEAQSSDQRDGRKLILALGAKKI